MNESPSHSSVRRRSRGSSRARRRKHTIIVIAFSATAVAFAASFVAGNAWGLHRMRAFAARAGAAQNEPSDRVARATALDAIDEAVTANYEGRKDQALAAIERARAADPAAPALDILRAQLALEAGNIGEARSFALASKQRQENVAGASLFLALDAWSGRGADDARQSQAIDTANLYFVEGAEANLFDSSLWFFWGDLLRSAGREKEGQMRASEALHRLNLWDSHLMLSLWLVSAADEGGLDLGEITMSGENLPARGALRALTQAVAEGIDPKLSFVALQSFLTLKQAEMMSAEMNFLFGRNVLSPLP
jgi:hypothetical protein